MAATKKAAYAEFHRIMSKGGEEPPHEIRVDSVCCEFMMLGLERLADNTAEWYARQLDSFALSCGLMRACDLRPIHLTALSEIQRLLCRKSQEAFVEFADY